MKKSQTDNLIQSVRKTLDAFKISYESVTYEDGLFVDEILVDISPGEKLSKLESIRNDLCRELRTETLMITNRTVDGSISLQIPKMRPTIMLPNILDIKQDTEEPVVSFGLDMSGSVLSVKLSDIVHLLVCGATKSGKSVFLRSVIQELILTKNVKVVLIDPKFVEFSHFANSSRLYGPVLYTADKVIDKLDLLILEMNSRYVRLMNARCVSIQDFNRRGEDCMDYIVVVCDELADLMMVSKKDIEDRISVLAAKSRAVGIHLVLATQRASSDVITGKLKVNLTTRVCFRVPTQVDSRVVLDYGGAEHLCGKGDGLLSSQLFYGLKRFQGAFIAPDDLRVDRGASDVASVMPTRTLSKPEQLVLAKIGGIRLPEVEVQQASGLNASTFIRTLRSLIKLGEVVKNRDGVRRNTT